jgi:hypothetical protein
MARVFLIPFTMALLLFGCFQEYSQENPKCPCEEGWKCCSDKCIPEKNICIPGDGGNGVEGDRDTVEAEGCASDGDLAGKDRGCCVYDSDCPDEYLCRNGICVHNQEVDGGSNNGGDGRSELIIAARVSGCGMGGWPSTEEVVIYLAYGTDHNDCLGTIGWETPHSGPGTTVYNSDNEAEYDDLVYCMTNGVDDRMHEGTMFYPIYNGASGSFSETEFWHKNPDLKGCTITRIRHVIESLVFTPSGGGALVDGEWVWEVWGNCGGD